MVNEISNSLHVPKGPQYAYHITSKENVDSILSGELDPHRTTNENWREVNDLIKKVSYRLSGTPPIPIDRNECVYLFDKKSTPMSFVNDNTENAVLVFDLSETSASFFVADMEPVTEIVRDNNKKGNLPNSLDPRSDDLTDTEQGYISLIRRHLESMTKAPNPASEPPIDAYDVEWISPDPISGDAVNSVYIQSATHE